MMNNKRGFMRILEATIAVMIVSGVLIVVYSKQVDRGIDAVDYFRSLQGQILSDISIRSDLRSSVLVADDENPDDPDFIILNDFVEDNIPDFVGYSISICDLGSTTDFCTMNRDYFVNTLDKDIFVEDTIISADLGDGSDANYNPRKFKLYMWEK